MKTFKLLLICAVAFASALTASAQRDSREPGLYTVVDGESIPLTFVRGAGSTSGTNILGVELGNKKYTFKEVTSDTPASGSFVLVINPDKKAIVSTLKMYDVFIQTMTPENMILVPLEVVKNKRVYDAGTSINGFNTTKKDRFEFYWEKITDNSFEITADLEPGEYAFVFKPTKIGAFVWDCVYDFTILVNSEAATEAAEQ